MNLTKDVIGGAILAGFLLGFALFTIPPVMAKTNDITYEAPPEAPKMALIEVTIDWTKDRINKEIEAKAAQYGASADYLKKIVQCESGYVIDVQSRHMLSYGREQSYGLAQIHLPNHPHITREQAIDPAFAIDYLAKHIANGTDYWACEHKI